MKNLFKIKIIAAILLLATLLTGCNDQPAETPHEHTWGEASCLAPKTCKSCGATEGEALGHTWAEATYSAPKTCTVCGLTEGEKLVSPIPEKYNLALGLEKVPVINPNMTEEEIRDMIVNFMYIQLNFAYTPDFGDALDEYGYYIKNLYGPYKGNLNLENTKVTFSEGKYYGGIPYVGNAAGSLYRWLEIYDADSGIVNWEPIMRTKRRNWEDNGITYPDVGSAIFGNSCSSACVWSWLRVSNSISSFWTSGWAPKNGYVQVGDYDLSSSGTIGSNSVETCKANGRIKMFEAYANIKKADGIVKTSHAIMCIEDAVVVRLSNGVIDGDNSYVLIAEQDCCHLTTSPPRGGVDRYAPLNDKGDVYRMSGNFAGNMDSGKVFEGKMTFQELYESGFLPFTIPELAGTDPIEKVSLELYKSNTLYTDSAVKVGDLKSMTIKCNYAISDIHFIIRDENGNEIFNAMYPKFANDVPTLMTYSLNDALYENTIFQNNGIINRAVWENAAGGKNTLEITARVSTGELLTVYKGTLTE